MNERREPFVGTLIDKLGGGLVSRRRVEIEHEGKLDIPIGASVVVIPLLSDDPKPGEVWTYEGEDARIMSTPFTIAGTERVAVELGINDRNGVTYPYVVRLDTLTHKPPEKTYTLSQPVEWLSQADVGTVVVRAPSKEAALAKLAEALEEVE